MVEDEWSEFAGEALDGPVIASGWFRPASYDGPVVPWLAPWRASQLSMAELQAAKESRARPEFVNHLPRLLYVAVTHDRLGVFDLDGRHHVHARRVVGSGDRNGVRVLTDSKHPTWLYLQLADRRVVALEPNGPDDDTESVRQAISA